ncbi:tetratricopeptide repeat protein [Paenibacillus sp. y28]|uniref:tetratricopeptide repeat protein n=1 Tax=Paenibacillus sp. y28 TaxID=3129110 RepID=UPI00301B2B91
MSKFILFSLLWWLTGNPFIAIVVLLVIIYVLDRRFVGLTPSIVKPLRRARKIRQLREELALSPHHTSNKLELARLLMEKKRFDEAAGLLEQVLQVMEDSADVRSELGICELRKGRLEQGEALIAEALELNPRVKYGEPYLELGEALGGVQPEKAIRYLQMFGQVNSSSCEAYYKLGRLYKKLGRNQEASGAFREAIQLYRGLPKYKRRHERKWALLARLQG